MRVDSPNSFGPAAAPLTDTRPVSEAQAKYLSDLRSEYVRLSAAVKAAGQPLAKVPSAPAPRNVTEARRSIEVGREAVQILRAQVRNLPVASAKPVAQIVRQTVTDGMWAIDGANGTTYFKVQVAVHGSGRLYAKRLTTDGTFVVAPGAVRDLAIRGRKMSLEEAKELGKLYGICVRCTRTLTDENSIAAGIGPICAEKF